MPKATRIQVKSYKKKHSTKIAACGLREVHLVNNKLQKKEELQLLANAELYRAMRHVRRGTISVPEIPDILPGQKVTVTATSANLTSSARWVLEVSPPDGNTRRLRHRPGSNR